MPTLNGLREKRRQGETGILIAAPRLRTASGSMDRRERLFGHVFSFPAIGIGVGLSDVLSGQDSRSRRECVNEVGWLLGPAVVGEAEGRAGRPDDHVGGGGE